MRAHHAATTAAQGTGYSYTIGTGGSSVMALLRDHLAPRLIGRDPAEIEADLARPAVRHPRHHGRRDHEPGAGRHRHRAVGLALPPRRPAAVEGRRRRQAAHPGLHHRGRLAAPAAPTTSCAQTLAAQGSRLQGRQDQGRPAARERRRGAPEGRARGGRRRLRDHGRRQPMLHAGRSAAPRAALCRARHRLVRGAAAGRRHRAVTRGWPRPARCRSRSASRCTHRRSSRPMCSRARRRSCRSTWRASAASRRGSRWRTWPRPSTWRSARIS